MNFKILAIPAAFAIGAVAMAALGPWEKPGDESDLPLPEFMGHVMQRNAVQLWQWSAIEVDAAGEHLGKPKTDEEWEDAESDALTLQQLTYALQHSRLRIDDARWDKHIADLRAATVASAQAAEKKDFTALVNAGNVVNEQCIACHMTFAPQLEAPPPELPANFGQ